MAKRKIGYFWYNTLLALAALVLSPFFIFRIIINFKSILAFFKTFSKTSKPVIWVHVALEDQITMVDNLLQELGPLLSGYQPVITYSGKKFAKFVQPINPEFIFVALPYPVEFCSNIIISRTKPSMFLMIEDCFYPNQIRFCKATGSKVVLINGVVNNCLALIDKLAPGFLKTVLEQIDLLIMVSVEEANRMGEIGAALSSILVCDTFGYQDTGSQEEAEITYSGSVKQTAVTIGTFLGRNF